MRPECVEKNYISCKVCPEYKKCPDADPLYKKNKKIKEVGKAMKIGKWHVDYDGEQYWVYDKVSFDKKTGKESPRATSYFTTLAGALSEVKHQLIGVKIGKGKEDDLGKVIGYITSVDEYFVKCLKNLTKEQETLADNLVKEQAVGQEE